jgi:hypothetical protein
LPFQQAKGDAPLKISLDIGMTICRILVHAKANKAGKQMNLESGPVLAREWRGLCGVGTLWSEVIVR